MVDGEARVLAFLPQLEELGIRGLITLERVQAVRFTGTEE